MLSILLPILYLLLFCFLLYKLPFYHIDTFRKTSLIYIFLLKTLCGFSLWWIYTNYYPERANADIFKYFDDASQILQSSNGNFSLLFQVATGIVWQKAEVYQILQETEHWHREYDFHLFNDNRTVIRLNLIVLLFSKGIFHVHTIFFAFFSLTGLMALYRFFNHYLSLKKTLFISVFLIPSVLLWTSGVLKEAWLIFVLGMFLWRVQKLLSKRNVQNSLWVVLLFIALIFIKPYVLLAIIPALIFLFLTKALSFAKNFHLFLIVHAVIILLLVFNNYFLPQLHLFELLNDKQSAFYNVANISNAGSVIDIPSVQNFASALYAAPLAIYNTLFLPWIFNSQNSLQLMASMENLIFLLLIILAIFFFKKPSGKSLKIFLFNLSFVIGLALLVGWTTPIVGAIVRYKVPLLPFLAILLFQIIDYKKLRNFLSIK